MASYDKQFEIVRPSWDRILRASHPISSGALLDPMNPSSLIDGEFVAFNAEHKLIRATSNVLLCYAYLDDRGDTGVQAHRKPSIVQGGSYEANTIVFNAAINTLGAPLMLGTVNNAAVGSVNRAGLTTLVRGATYADPQPLIIGYVTRLAANNGGRLRFQHTLC